MAQKLALRPTRKTRGGKSYGNFYVELRGGGRVNLRTKDAERARRRAKEAARGVREWPDDGDGGEAGAVASAVTATVAGTKAEKASVVEPPAPSSPGPVPSASASPAALPPLPSAAPKNGAAVHPDAYIPPPAGWAASVTAAAADTEGKKAAGQAAAADEEDDQGDEADADPLEDMEFLRGLLEQGAALAVELQIVSQEWLLRRGAIPKLKIKAAPVPADNKGRELGQRIWFSQLKKWVPLDKLKIPEWVAAILIVGAYTVPVQLGDGAEEIKDDAKPKPPAAASAPAAPEARAA